MRNYRLKYYSYIFVFNSAASNCLPIQKRDLEATGTQREQGK